MTERTTYKGCAICIKCICVWNVLCSIGSRDRTVCIQLSSIESDARYTHPLGCVYVVCHGQWNERMVQHISRCVCIICSFVVPQFCMANWHMNEHKWINVSIYRSQAKIEFKNFNSTQPSTIRSMHLIYVVAIIYSMLLLQAGHSQQFCYSRYDFFLFCFDKYSIFCVHSTQTCLFVP